MNPVRFHSSEVPEILKNVETEGRMVVAGEQREGGRNEELFRGFNRYRISVLQDERGSVGGRWRCAPWCKCPQRH